MSKATIDLENLTGQLLDWYVKQADVLVHNFKHFVKLNPAKETINKIMKLYKVL